MRLAVAVCLVAVAGFASAARPLAVEDIPSYSFEQYVAEHGKVYTGAEYVKRLALFTAAKAEVVAHNALPSSFTKTINKFTDMTAEERASYRGGMNSAFVNYEAESQKEFDLPLKPIADLPKAVDWRSQGVITAVKDQAQCGSCYAFATTETVESHVGLSNKFHAPPVLAEQQLVSCVKNPQHCGGTGGCMGGIPEVSYDYIKSAGGMTQAFFYGYTSAWGDSGTCLFNNVKTKGGTPAIATIDGFMKLPVNNMTAVMNVLATVGPLAVNVAAADWHNYGTGIYTQCSSTTTDIDHVVQLVGYGEDNGQLYWTVRNSWSPEFGEGGFIRIARASSDSTLTCGVDKSPMDGTGCTGGPSEVTVCGSCGMVYDTSFPTGARYI